MHWCDVLQTVQAVVVYAFGGLHDIFQDTSYSTSPDREYAPAVKKYMMITITDAVVQGQHGRLLKIGRTVVAMPSLSPRYTIGFRSLSTYADPELKASALGTTHVGDSLMFR